MTGQAPDVYMGLTRLERTAFADAALDCKKKGW
jgi:hypothetical protein